MVDQEPTTKTVTGSLSEHLSDYVETYARLTGVHATKAVTVVATISFTAILMSFFGMLIMIFLGFGMAAWFNESMSEKKGYFIITLVYSLFTAVVLVCRKRFIFPFIRNLIVRKIYESKPSDIR